MAKTNPVLCKQLKALVAKYLVSNQDYEVKIYKDTTNCLCITLTYIDDNRTGYITFISFDYYNQSNIVIINAITNNDKNFNYNYPLQFERNCIIFWQPQTQCFCIKNDSGRHDLPQFLNKVIIKITMLAINYINCSSRDIIQQLQSLLVDGKFKDL